MFNHLTDEARAAIADKRAEIAAAQTKADTFARVQMDPVAARHAGLRHEQIRLGGPPDLDAYVTAAEWRQAKDQHTFDSRYLEREAAAVEAKLNTLRDQHQLLLAEVPTLKQQLRKMVLEALERAVLRAANEAAEIAHIRQSFLNRVPLEQRRVVLPDASADASSYQVQGSGWPDMSFFQARIQRDGFGPDKSAALVAELGLS